MEVYVKADVDTLATHRSNIAAADTGNPAAGNFWLNTEKARYIAIYAEITFSGGSTPDLDLTLWFKSTGQATPLGVSETVFADLDGGKHALMAEVHGQDVFVYVDDVTGSPTSFDVDVYIQAV